MRSYRNNVPLISSIFFFNLRFLSLNIHELQDSRESRRAILTPLCLFTLLHEHVDSSWAIPTGSSPLHMTNDLIRAGNPSFPCAICYKLPYFNYPKSFGHYISSFSSFLLFYFKVNVTPILANGIVSFRFPRKIFLKRKLTIILSSIHCFLLLFSYILSSWADALRSTRLNGCQNGNVFFIQTNL